MGTGVFEKLNTEIAGEVDLIVAGGGVAGVAAAVQAKRAGVKSVLLLEKSYVLGGLATQGLVTLYEPLDDGTGKRITYGMAEEMLRRFTEFGADQLPAEWSGIPNEVPDCRKRCKTFYSQSYALIALDAMLSEAGVNVLFDSRVVGAEMQGNTCTGVFVETTEGRVLYKTKAVIDATGDAGLLTRMGVPCVDGKNRPAIMMKTVDPDSMRLALASGNIMDLYRHHMLLSRVDERTGIDAYPDITGITSREISDYLLYTRRKALDATKDNPRMARDIAQLPMMPQLRTIRHIDGEYTVTDADLNMAIKDSVATIPDFLAAEKWYDIPYRSMIHKDYPNVWAAGRITAAEGWAWLVVRVIPGCVASGQAAGMAAALCIERNKTAQELPYEVLKDALQLAGVRFHAEHMKNNEPKENNQ